MELADPITILARVFFGAVGAVLAVTLLKRTPLPTFGFQSVSEAEERKKDLADRLANHRKERDALQDELRTMPPHAPEVAAEMRARQELLAATLQDDIATDTNAHAEVVAYLQRQERNSYVAGFAVYILGGVAFAVMLTGVIIVELPAGVPDDAGSALIIGATWPTFLGAFRLRSAYEGAQQDYERTVEKLQKELVEAKKALAKATPAAAAEGHRVDVATPIDVLERRLERERERGRESMARRVKAA